MINQILNKRYKIIKLLGEGGMGEVYLADDEQTKQKVAVKILARQLVTNTGLMERFRREAETLQKLDHPNIVKFIDAFEYESQYVIVMEYVAGGNLQDLIKKGKLPIEHARRIALELCDALIRSHHLNIIHRDIKPENVLLTDDGKPKLADFGVARLNEGSRMTRTGTQVGTPYYMSPEAWEGKSLNAQADIWSLGVMFFEMLAGQVPFEGDTGAVVMNKVLTSPPPDLRELRKEVPIGITNIIAGMLARDKKQRYESARQVAADLEKGKSSITLISNTNNSKTIITEKPRKSRIAITVVGLLIITALLVISGNLGLFSNNNASQLESTLSPTAKATLVEFTFTPTITATSTLSYPLLIGTLIPELSIITLENTNELVEIARWGNGKINDLIISPDNQMVYVGSSIGLFFYNAETLEEKKYIPRNPINNLIISPDGKSLAFTEGSKIITFDIENNEEQIKYEETSVVKLQYLPNGKLFAIRDVTEGFNDFIQIIDLENSDVIAQINNKSAFAGYRVEISPTGSHVAVVENKSITTYDLSTARKSRSYGSHKALFITSLAFSSDQKLLASGDRDGKVYIWNLESGQPIYIFSNPETVYYLKFSPDNKKVFAALENGTIQVWDLITGKIDVSYTGHVGEIAAFSVSQDGTRLISGAFDGRVIIWSLSDGKRLVEIPAGSAGITSVDISPDDSIIASGANDYSVILWEMATGQKIKDFPGSSNSFSNQTFCSNCDFYGVESLVFSPDGFSLAAGYSGERGTLWDISSGKPIRAFKGNTFAFCPNQSFSISASLKDVHFLDLTTGLETFKLSGKTCSVDTVACSADGSLFAYRGTELGCGGLPDKVILTDLESMANLYEFRGNTLYSPELSFSPDGSLLAAGASDGIRLWTTSTGQEIPGPILEKEIYPSLADFSPDGSILTYLSDYNKISFFDISNNIIVSTIEISTSNFRAFKFSHDGKYLVTGHSDGTIRVWGLKP